MSETQPADFRAKPLLVEDQKADDASCRAEVFIFSMTLHMRLAKSSWVHKSTGRMRGMDIFSRFESSVILDWCTVKNVRELPLLNTLLRTAPQSKQVLFLHDQVLSKGNEVLCRC